MFLCRLFGHREANVWPLRSGKREFYTVCLRCGKTLQYCEMR